MRKSKKLKVLLALLLALAQMLCLAPGALTEEIPEEAPAAVVEVPAPEPEETKVEVPAAEPEETTAEVPAAEVSEEIPAPAEDALPPEAEPAAVPEEAPAPVAEAPLEPEAPETEAPAEAAQPVRVAFVGTPAEARVTVYPVSSEMDGEAAIPVEADGTCLLPPGAYTYSAVAEGCSALERVPFEVTADAAQPLEIRFALEALEAAEAILPAEIIAASGEETVALPEAAGDNDAQFEAFIRRTLPGLNSAPRLMLRRAVNGGRANLNGASAMLYDLLRPLVAEVAAGRRTSTVFDFSAEDLGLGNAFWNQADLGLDSLIEEKDGRYFITAAAVQAMFDKTGIDTDAVMHALLVDCPYDLYWFDKQIGMGSSYSSSIQQEAELRIGISQLTITLYVARDYAAGDNRHVNAQLPARVNKAAANITRIIQENAGQSDYQKLVNYKNEICKLVSYNSAAAGTFGTPYGDPWQLVYVFDGDTSTNVVCEGYSKAFMYLCEQTDFKSARIGCIVVTGVMSGGTGAGRHMWNIVSMPDGAYYLVDITNSDSGTAGSDGQLFLKGWYSHDSAASYAYKTRSTGGFTSYVYDESVYSTFGSDSPWLKLSQKDYSGSAAASATVSFAANGGSGSMSAQSVEEGTAFVLPTCGFVPPSGREFAGWQVDGEGSALFAPGNSITVRTDVIVTAVWRERPKFTQYTLLLSGQIGVNFYLKLPGGKSGFAGRSVNFTVNGATTSVPVEAGVQDSTTGADEYRYVCYINSVQMADVITAEYVCGDGVVVSARGSAAGYIQAIQNNGSVSASVRRLAAALADYGSRAQTYLSALRGWKVGEGKDHAPVKGQTASFDLEAIREKVASAGISGSLGTSGVTKVTESLTLDSETTLNLYLYAANDFAQDVTYTVSAEGKQIASGKALWTRKGRYKIAIEGISAHELGTTYTVTARTGKGEVQVSASALSYVNTVLSNPEGFGTGAPEAVAALYNYYDAAVEALSK